MNPALLWFVTNRVPTIGAVCGKGLCVGIDGATLGSVDRMDNSRGLAEELTPLKPRSQAKRKLSFGQNQSITWSSDSSLWGNQLLG